MSSVKLKCFGHHHQVIKILAIDRDILNMPLDGSGLFNSISAIRDVCLESYMSPKSWPKVAEYLKLTSLFFHQGLKFETYF